MKMNKRYEVKKFEAASGDTNVAVFFNGRLIYRNIWLGESEEITIQRAVASALRRSIALV